MATLLAFLKALPAFFRLFQLLEKRIAEAAIERRVVDDVKTIGEAFKEKDPAKLDALFSKP